MVTGMYWARRMDTAENRSDFLQAWDEWWKREIGPRAKLVDDDPTPERQAERILTGQWSD